MLNVKKSGREERKSEAQFDDTAIDLDVSQKLVHTNANIFKERSDKTQTLEIVSFGRTTGNNFIRDAVSHGTTLSYKLTGSSFVGDY